MEKIKDFAFTINVSIDSYKDKVEAQDCISSRELAKKHNKAKMSFIEKDVTTGDFLTLATTGHSFANLFDLEKNRKYSYTYQGFTTWTSAYYTNGKNKGGLKLCFKTNEHYRGQQVLFVDIDYTNFDSIYDYIDCLTYTPTIMYTSFSDLKMKGGVVSRRFRLVYVFDKILNKDEVDKVSKVLYASIIEDTDEPIEDECGLVGSQYMNGTNSNIDTFNSNIIYSTTDFEEEETIEVTEEEVQPKEDKEVVIDKFLLGDMKRFSYEEFMHYNSTQYTYFYRTEKNDWIDDKWQYTDENYLALYYNVDKVIDGEKRRKTLFERMCLRRIIRPEATPEDILFNAYVDLNFYFNNDDDVVTIDCLKANVINAFKLSLDNIRQRYSAPIEYSRLHRPQFIIKHQQGIVKKEVISKVRKQITDEEIGSMYDLTLSVSENLEVLDGKVSKSRIYEWLKEHNIKAITSTKQKDLVKSMVDATKSIRENIKMLEEKGIKTNYRQVREALSK